MLSLRAYYWNLESIIKPSLFSGISLDWEDRQYYISYENRLNYSPTIDNFFLQKARVGFAPYIGKYGDLHTWLMFKTKKNSLRDSWSTYPVIKFFKGDFLIELGYNNKTRTDAHLMYRF